MPFYGTQVRQTTRPGSYGLEPVTPPGLTRLAWACDETGCIVADPGPVWPTGKEWTRLNESQIVAQAPKYGVSRASVGQWLGGTSV